MKWTCCIITLNGAEYIWHSIKSVYDFIKDKDGQIIIIEGSTKYAEMVSEDGNSVDDTENIIEGFIKDSEPGFIIYKRFGTVEDKKVLRNAYFEEIRKLSIDKQPDWILVLDDDELYKKEDLERLDSYLEKNPRLCYIFNPQRWFWGDFKHVAITDENECRKQIEEGKRKDKIFYDAVGNRLRQGQYHERIFKWMPGLSYKGSHSVVTDPQGRDIYIDPFYEDNRIIFPGCPRYHYGYMTTLDRMYERYRYYELRDQGKVSSNKEEVWKDNYGHWLLYDLPLNTSTKVEKYYGNHPEIIKKHPYWKKGMCPMKEDAEKYQGQQKFSWVMDQYDLDGKYIILNRHAIALPRLKPKSRILDVGGKGKFAKRLGQEGHSATVLNLSKDELRTRSDSAAKFHFNLGSIFEYRKGEKGVFDYVNASETLEHIKDQQGAINNIYRLLKTGGAFFGTVPEKGVYHHDDEKGITFIDEEQMKNMLNEAGFNNVELKWVPSMNPEDEPHNLWWWAEK